MTEVEPRNESEANPAWSGRARSGRCSAMIFGARAPLNANVGGLDAVTASIGTLRTSS